MRLVDGWFLTSSFQAHDNSFSAAEEKTESVNPQILLVFLWVVVFTVDSFPHRLHCPESFSAVYM